MKLEGINQADYAIDLFIETATNEIIEYLYNNHIDVFTEYFGEGKEEEALLAELVKDIFGVCLN